MADEVTRIVLKATDETKAAFDSAKASFDGIKTAAGQLQGILGPLGAALGVGIGIAAFTNTTKQVLELEDTLLKMSQRTGVAVESLSTLRYAADLSGVGLDDLNGLLVKLNKTLGEAGAGDEKAAKFLSQFGIAAKDAKSGALSADEALKRIADRFSTAPDGINKTSAALELAGKSAASLIPFLNQGREGIEALQSEARKLGLEISNNAAKQAEALNDQLRTLKFAAESARIAMVNDMVPALNDITKAMRDATLKGGLFSGVMAGIKTALLGGDQYKNDIELIRLTEKKLALEQQLQDAQDTTKAFRGVNATKVKEELADTEAQLKVVLATRTEMEKTAKAEAEAARIAEERRNKGNQIQLKPSADLDKYTAQLKAVQSFADTISQQLTGKLGGEFDQLRKKASDVFGKVELNKLNPKQAEEYAAALKKVNGEIGQLERLDTIDKQLKYQAESFNAIAKAADSATDATVGFYLAQRRAEQDLEFELEMVGKLSIERQKLTAMRRIDSEERDAIKAIPENDPDYDGSIQRILKESEQARARTSDLYDAIRAKSRDTFLGLKSAAADYFDRVSDGAQNMRNAFNTVMGSLEDTLVKTFTTGKLSVKDFVDVAVSELVRLQVRQNIVAPLSKSLSSLDFSNLFGSSDPTQSLSYGLGGAFAAGGRPPIGKVSVVGEQGPELFVPDSAGTIVPNHALGGAPSVTVVQNINIDSRSDRGTILAAMAQAKELAKAEIMDSMLRGGAFAR